MRVLSVENCNKNPIIAVDANFTANLSPKCIVTSSGCITSKGFEQAKVLVYTLHVDSSRKLLLETFKSNFIYFDCTHSGKIFNKEKYNGTLQWKCGYL